MFLPSQWAALPGVISAGKNGVRLRQGYPRIVSAKVEDV